MAGVWARGWLVHGALRDTAGVLVHPRRRPFRRRRHAGNGLADGARAGSSDPSRAQGSGVAWCADCCARGGTVYRAPSGKASASGQSRVSHPRGAAAGSGGRVSTRPPAAGDQRTHTCSMSTAHWHPLVNGYGAFWPADLQRLAQETDTFPSEGALEVVRNWGVRYVVVHAKLYERHGLAREADVSARARGDRAAHDAARVRSARSTVRSEGLGPEAPAVVQFLKAVGALSS